MGYPYHELVPVAILWDNPGVTKEEFSTLLDEFKGGEFEIPKHKKEWDEQSRYPVRYEIRERISGIESNPQFRTRPMTPAEIEVAKEEERKRRKMENLVRWDLRGYHKNNRESDIYPYHQGLYGVARMLNMNDHPEFEEQFTKAFPAERDEFGFYYNSVSISPFFLLGTRNGKKSLFMELIFRGPGCLEGKATFGKFHVFEEKKKGDVVYSAELNIQAPYALIEKTVKTHRRKNGSIKSQAMQVRGINIPLHIYRIGVEELVQEYPFFAAERMFDFSQPRGEFWGLDSAYEKEAFQWIQKNGKYYLDVERMMENVKSGDLISKGYADLIVTREAVRKKAWKLLTYRGLTHFECFFNRWPEAKWTYEKAVVDSHTSLYAKGQGMTHFDLMRMRLLGRTNEEIRRAQSRAIYL